jgi:hypothetical protein
MDDGEEISNGTDPLTADSQPEAVPAISWIGYLILMAFLIAIGFRQSKFV